MNPPIYAFLHALLTPATSLATLQELHVETDPLGRPSLNRTARFAEARIEWHGSRWLLAMPLTAAAIPAVERMAAYLKTLRSAWLTDYMLLRDELRYEDSGGTARRCDLLLQRLPGCSFDAALAGEEPGRLQAALEALEAELARLDISHGNLKAENLRWTAGRLVPIRYYYACKGAGKDSESFRSLRSLVSDAAAPSTAGQVGDVGAAYGIPDRFPGHRWVGRTFEQMVCVEDEDGYGYVDTSNRPVIPAQYVWADDFREGRAAIETKEGKMGLIDKTGRYVIPPLYEIVEYNRETGYSEVRLNDRWTNFDYEGRQLGEFAPRPQD